MIFAEAGIRPGMRVLDLGCGAGNVSFVAASLVGPDGYVVGVDSSPDALARARLRAGQRGLTQVQFVEGDIHDPAPGGPFDAIVERLALWLVPDPAEVLRRQATVLAPWRPGRAGRNRSFHEPVAARECVLHPGQLLADRSVRQGRTGHDWPAAVGHCLNKRRGCAQWG
jgi:SAM-dependent methyltransferase